MLAATENRASYNVSSSFFILGEEWVTQYADKRGCIGARSGPSSSLSGFGTSYFVSVSTATSEVDVQQKQNLVFVLVVVLSVFLAFSINSITKEAISIKN